MDETPRLVFLCYGIVLTLHVFAESLYVLNHQVFLTKFFRIWEMVQDLVVVYACAGIRVKQFVLNCVR